MSDLDSPIECFECGKKFKSIEAVAMHYINTQDDNHDMTEKYRIKYKTEQHNKDDNETDEKGKEAGGEEKDESPSEENEAEANPVRFPRKDKDVCPRCNETMQPATGVFELDSGGRVKADQEDRFCPDCEILVESDGEVLE